MSFINLSKPLLVILGPTAVGKTDLSILLAERLEGEIVSADSRLFYRGMDIGTAKPGKVERLRVPHHLIDMIDPDEDFSLSLFQQMAIAVIEEVHARQKLPILVGGTGQYIQALLEGWKIPEQKPNPLLREAITKWAMEIGVDELHRKLALIDPHAAEHIEPQNVRRTVRALEVIFGSGKLFSDEKKKSPPPYTVCRVGLTRPRDELYRRVDQRIDMMLADGFLEETQNLLDAGYSPDLPSLSAIGYREMIAYLKGTISLEEAVMLIKRTTRRFIRHQANWFKPDDPTIHWFTMHEAVLEEVINCVMLPESWQKISIYTGGEE